MCKFATELSYYSTAGIAIREHTEWKVCKITYYEDDHEDCDKMTFVGPESCQFCLHCQLWMRLKHLPLQQGLDGGHIMYIRVYVCIQVYVCMYTRISMMIMTILLTCILVIMMMQLWQQRLHPTELFWVENFRCQMMGTVLMGVVDCKNSVIC